MGSYLYVGRITRNSCAFETAGREVGRSYPTNPFCEAAASAVPQMVPKFWALALERSIPAIYEMAFNINRPTGSLCRALDDLHGWEFCVNVGSCCTKRVKGRPCSSAILTRDREADAAMLAAVLPKSSESLQSHYSACFLSRSIRFTAPHYNLPYRSGSGSAW